MIHDFIALISGGKDSIYAIQKLQKQGHNLKGLLYIKNTTTIDSFMYQTVGHELIHLYSECLQVPIITYTTTAKPINQNLNYTKTQEDEVESLYLALKQAQVTIDFNAVSTGAILSNYQKIRVDNVCNRLALHHLAPLWMQDQKELLDEMILCGINAIVVKIATPGCGSECVGISISDMKKQIDLLWENNSIYRYISYCGEGGEFESLVLDAPFFKKKISILESEVLRHPEENEREWNVYYMKINKFILVNK